MKPDLSIIVPFYNEEDNVAALCAAVTAALCDHDYRYELILVDDGSSDATFQIAAEQASKDSRIKVIKFRRNYGQTPAMAAGIDYARGSVLVTMDGDLQNDPADIPMFMEKMAEGYDIVVGWRFNRQDKLITRKIPSRIANRIIGKVTGIPIRDNGCSLKAYRDSVIKEVPLYSEMHRFIPAMASITGARVAEVKVRHHARQFGESKYGLSRIYKVIFDLLAVKTLTSFAAQPLRWFGFLAIPFLFLSFAMFVAAGFTTTSNGSSLPISFTGSGVLFGALTVSMVGAGILAEMVYRAGSLKLETFYKFTMSRPGKTTGAPAALNDQD